jgi:peptidoglycan hydrolase-like protein with peptidoglycan-binding domain
MENVPLDKVQSVQQALVDAGYDVGPDGADGKFGRNTRAAVIKYQKANGIKQTGNVGPLTAGKLGVQPLTSGKPVQKPTPKPIVKDKEKVTQLFSFEVIMMVHIVADTEEKAKTDLDEKGGIVTKREVKLLHTATLYGEEKE